MNPQKQDPRNQPGQSGPCSQAGQSLVEFSFVFITLFFLCMFGIEMVRAFIIARHVQSVSAQISLVAATSSGDLLEPVATRGALPASRFFDPNLTVIDIDGLKARYPGPGMLMEKAERYLRAYGKRTLGNRLLLPIMWVDRRDGKRLLRLPGTLYKGPRDNMFHLLDSSYVVIASTLKEGATPSQDKMELLPYVQVDMLDDSVRTRVRVPINFLSLIKKSDVPVYQSAYSGNQISEGIAGLKPGGATLVDPGVYSRTGSAGGTLVGRKLQQMTRFTLFASHAMRREFY